MEILDTFEIDLPEYAVIPIEYDDYTGLSDEDEKLVRDYLDTLAAEYPNKYIAFNYSENRSFTPYPEFGMACTTVETTLTVYE